MRTNLLFKYIAKRKIEDILKINKDIIKTYANKLYVINGNWISVIDLLSTLTSDERIKELLIYIINNSNKIVISFNSIKDLLNEITNKKIIDVNNDTLLHYYISSLEIDINEKIKNVEELIPIINVNLKNNQEETPLFIAIKKKYGDIVELLIRAGADVNLADKDGNTPLYNAIFIDNIEIVELLLKEGADVNKPSGVDKQTPLHYAVYSSNIEIIKLLLEVGADINAIDSCDETPLYIAIGDNNKEMVELLLKEGSKINIINCSKESPLHIAVYNNNIEIVELLLKEGAEINKKNGNEETPLHIAVSGYSYYNREIVELLLKAGAKVDIPNVMKKTVKDMIENIKKEDIKQHYLQLVEKYSKKEGGYYNKYLKYKQKYLELKKHLNF